MHECVMRIAAILGFHKNSKLRIVRWLYDSQTSPPPSFNAIRIRQLKYILIDKESFMAKIQINEEVMMDYVGWKVLICGEGGKIASCGSLSKHRSSCTDEYWRSGFCALYKAPVRLSH